MERDNQIDEILSEYKQYIAIEVNNHLVHLAEGVLAHFLSELEKNSQVNIIKFSGERYKPNLIVFKTSPEVLEKITSKFGNKLLVEEDKSLIFK